MVEDTEQALGNIVKGVNNVNNLIENIATASNEQAESISQVNIGLVQINNITQEFARNAEKTATASENLASQNMVVQDLLSQFQIEDNIKLLR